MTFNRHRKIFQASHSFRFFLLFLHLLEKRRKKCNLKRDVSLDVAINESVFFKEDIFDHLLFIVQINSEKEICLCVISFGNARAFQIR